MKTNTKEIAALCKHIFPAMELVHEQDHCMHLLITLSDQERLVTITASPGWHFCGWYLSICVASPDGPHEIFQYEETNVESCFYKHVEDNRADAIEKLKATKGLPKFITDQYHARINQINPFKFTPLSK